MKFPSTPISPQAQNGVIGLEKGLTDELCKLRILGILSKDGLHIRELLAACKNLHILRHSVCTVHCMFAQRAGSSQLARDVMWLVSHFEYYYRNLRYRAIGVYEFKPLHDLKPVDYTIIVSHAVRTVHPQPTSILKEEHIEVDSWIEPSTPLHSRFLVLLNRQVELEMTVILHIQWMS